METILDILTTQHVGIFALSERTEIPFEVLHEALIVRSRELTVANAADIADALDVDLTSLIYRTEPA